MSLEIASYASCPHICLFEVMKKVVLQRCRSFARGAQKHIDQAINFFNDTATTEIYSLSLHDALPISLEIAFYASCRHICLFEVMKKVVLQRCPSFARG